MSGGIDDIIDDLGNVGGFVSVSGVPIFQETVQEGF